MYKIYRTVLGERLAELKVSNGSSHTLSEDEGFQKWVDLTAALRDRGSVMYMVGNGASAMMASHMAADASKNGKIRARALNDAALMTAVANDVAYDEIFAMPLMRYANPEDVLVTISSSGNSKNIVRAIEQACEIGMKVITLSGMKPDNRSRAMGDLNFYIPATTYGIVECAHQIVLHYWLDLYITCNVEGSAPSLHLPEN